MAPRSSKLRWHNGEVDAEDHLQRLSNGDVVLGIASIVAALTALFSNNFHTIITVLNSDDYPLNDSDWGAIMLAIECAYRIPSPDGIIHLVLQGAAERHVFILLSTSFPFFADQRNLIRHLRTANTMLQATIEKLRRQLEEQASRVSFVSVAGQAAGLARAFTARVGLPMRKIRNPGHAFWRSRTALPAASSFPDASFSGDGGARVSHG